MLWRAALLYALVAATTVIICAADGDAAASWSSQPWPKLDAEKCDARLTSELREARATIARLTSEGTANQHRAHDDRAERLALPTPTRHQRLLLTTPAPNTSAPTAVPSPAPTTNPTASPVPTTTDLTTFKQLYNAIANGESTILIPAGIIEFGAEIMIESGGSVAVAGDDKNTVLSGGGHTRLFSVWNSSELTLTDLSLVNGSVSMGDCASYLSETDKYDCSGSGVFVFEAKLTVLRCIFRNHAAYAGAAIMVQFFGIVHVENSTLKENTGVGSSCIEVGRETCQLTLVGSVVSLNRAEFSTIYCIGWPTGDGADTETQMTLTDTTFSDNTATYGVAIWLWTTTITGCHFYRNMGTSAAAVTSGNLNIWGYGLTTTSFITGCVFDSNVEDDSRGGAFEVGAGGKVVITRCVFKSNVVLSLVQGGGAVNVEEGSNAVFEDCQFISNYAAVRVTDSTVRFDACLWDSNYGSVAESTSLFILESTAEIRNSTFRNNFMEPRAIECHTVSVWRSSLDISDTIFEGNAADLSESGEAIRAYDSATLNAQRCIFRANNMPAVVAAGGGCTVTLSECWFIDNVAKWCTFDISAGSKATIADSFFVGNAAEEGGVITATGVGTSVTVRDSVFSNHTSSTGHIIHDRTGVDFAVVLDTVAFHSNLQPALASTGGAVLVQNCEGLEASDTINVSVGTCANTDQFCLAASCTDDDEAVGTTCECVVDGVVIGEFPSGCLEVGEALSRTPSPGPRSESCLLPQVRSPRSPGTVGTCSHKPYPEAGEQHK
jgi:hypothetical protein